MAPGKPTPAQALALRKMAENRDFRILWMNHRAAWMGMGSYRAGTLRSGTVRVLASQGWIELEDPEESDRLWRISEEGRGIVGVLEPADFVKPALDVSADDVRRALRRWFCAPYWFWAEELSLGDWGQRRIDGFALRLVSGDKRDHTYYLTSWAIEIKVDRGDFARELADPAKRRPAMFLANTYWFAAPAGMIKPHELPENAGLIEVHDHGRLTFPVDAVHSSAEHPDWKLVASLARAHLRMNGNG